ncbi:MAG: hypothetical protein MUO63_15525, partial [Desulfobulbaceae bacterium]|nr:hypothetical protein [Desulfobulbaceae bacterium]
FNKLFADNETNNETAGQCQQNSDQLRKSHGVKPPDKIDKNTGATVYRGTAEGMEERRKRDYQLIILDMHVSARTGSFRPRQKVIRQHDCGLA